MDNFDILKSQKKIIFVLFNNKTIGSYDLLKNPKSLFDISNNRFSNGQGDSWKYEDYKKTWSFSKEDLMSLNYDTFSIKSSILDEIKTAELNIKDNDLLSKVIRARLHGFYGTMYGRPKDEIVYIESRDFNPAINVDGNLTYIWGWPGPDYNVYEYEDYGITWALTLDDFNMEKVNG